MAAKGEQAALFKYKFAEDYNPSYVNGAWGGVTTQGEICLNFYLERQPLPTHQRIGIRRDGTLGEVIEQAPDDDAEVVVLRFVSTGVLMSLDTAKAVRSFIDAQIQKVETARQEVAPGALQ